MPIDALAPAVQQLAHGPTQAYGHMRRLMRQSFERDLVAQLDAEAQSFNACARTTDMALGLQAFFDKRPAAFLGQ